MGPPLGQTDNKVNLQHLKKHQILYQVSTESTLCDCIKDQPHLHVHLEKRMFLKVLCHVFVPSSGLEENNVKGAFYPRVPLAPLYPNNTSIVALFRKQMFRLQ